MNMFQNLFKGAQPSAHTNIHTKINQGKLFEKQDSNE